MITYIDISLFDSPAQTLVNTVNTVGVMGKGIAAVFKKLYPDMFQRYRELCFDGKLDIGKLYVYRTPNKIVVNFPTKKHWRNPSQVTYIEAGLEKFVGTYHEYGISSVAFPQLGCGHGELDWENQVQPIMEAYLRNLPMPVYIHLYSKSPDFTPERYDVNYAKEMRLERRQISSSQLWMDLQKLLSSDNRSPFYLDMFTSVEINEEHLIFVFDDRRKTVFRQDIEDIWDTLRVRGTLRESELPPQLYENDVVTKLFVLLKHLSYIAPATLSTRKKGVLVREEGLQYIPQPNHNVNLENELVL